MVKRWEGKERVRDGTTADAEVATPADAERGRVHKGLAASHAAVTFLGFCFRAPHACAHLAKHHKPFSCTLLADGGGSKGMQA